MSLVLKQPSYESVQQEIIKNKSNSDINSKSTHKQFTFLDDSSSILLQTFCRCFNQTFLSSYLFLSQNSKVSWRSFFIHQIAATCIFLLILVFVCFWLKTSSGRCAWSTMISSKSRNTPRTKLLFLLPTQGWLCANPRPWYEESHPLLTEPVRRFCSVICLSVPLMLPKSTFFWNKQNISHPLPCLIS